MGLSSLARRLWLPLLLSHLLAFSAHADEDQELLLTLIRQQSAAKDRIQNLHITYTYRIEQTREPIYDSRGNLKLAGGREIMSGTGEYWQSGDKHKEVQRFQKEYPERDAVMQQERQKISTPYYYVEYIPEIAHLFVYHLHPGITPPEIVDLSRSHFPTPDPLSRGLGLEFTSLLDFYEHHEKLTQHNYSWTIREGPDGIYHLRHYYGSSDKTLNAEIDISPRQGFLITRFVMYGRKGVSQRFEVEPLEISDGVWLPGEVSAFEEDDGGEHSQFTLIDASIDVPLPEELFSPTAIDAAMEDLVLQEVMPDNSHITKAFFNGHWIPESLWPDEVKMHLKDVRENRLPKSWIKGGPSN